MSRSTFPMTGLAVIVFAAGTGGLRDLEARPRGRPVQVSADNLTSGKSVVIGRLGIPLKTMATIRGVWNESNVDKEPDPRFSITHIDGRALRETVEFERRHVEVFSLCVDEDQNEVPCQPTPKAGDLWEFRGFESGMFCGQPREFEERSGTLAMQQPRSDPFQSRLKGVAQQPGEMMKAEVNVRKVRLKVSADDLNSGKAVILGRLAIPLKTMATIRGVWKFPPRGEFPAKDGSPTFHVTHVDGDLVKQPATFHRALVRMSSPRSEKDVEGEEIERPNPADGEVWEFRGFESGRFFGTPAEFEERLKLPTSAAPVWQRGEFVTHLEGIFARPAPEKPEKDVGKAVKAVESDDHTLIAGLRSRNKPAGRYSEKLGRPVFPEDYDWEEQARVITLWRRIDERAPDFLPALVQHMEDPEYCVTFAGVFGNWRNYSVGEVCRRIVERNVMPVKLYDEGFRGFSPWSKMKGGVREFLASRRHMPLQAIQRETLTQLLEHLGTLPDSTLEETRQRAIEERLSTLIDQIDETSQPIAVRTARGESPEFVNFPIRKNFKAAPLEKGK